MLIALEGIDGSGKTTIAARLAEKLRGCGLDVVETQEPWRSAAGRKLRELLASAHRTTSGDEELALFHEDRAEHVAQVVRPALARGGWVVQDRTFWSTAAYQGARGVPVDEILAKSLAIAPRPDLTLLLAISPEQALARIASGRSGTSSFERLEDLRAVARVYAELARREPSFVVIDAERTREEVEASVEAACRARTGKP